MVITWKTGCEQNSSAASDGCTRIARVEKAYKDTALDFEQKLETRPRWPIQCELSLYQLRVYSKRSIENKEYGERGPVLKNVAMDSGEVVYVSGKNSS